MRHAFANSASFDQNEEHTLWIVGCARQHTPRTMARRGLRLWPCSSGPDRDWHLRERRPLCKADAQVEPSAPNLTLLERRAVQQSLELAGRIGSVSLDYEGDSHR